MGCGSRMEYGVAAGTAGGCHCRDLVPNATSPAYAYQNGYVEVSVLELGQSYWLKFDADETVSVCGKVRRSATVSLSAPAGT